MSRILCTVRLFLGWKHPGPIEAIHETQPFVEHLPFLGWKHPGPIEAQVLGRDNLQGWPHFWDGNIPAPLKPRDSSGGVGDLPDFWDGNIPAPLKHAAHETSFHRGRDFWDGNIPAPLKPPGRRPALQRP